MNARVLLTTLLTSYGAIGGCSAAGSDSSATNRPDTPVAGPGPPIVAAAVCDTVAARWQRADISSSRSDSIASMNSMKGSAPVCVVTAIAESDPDLKLMSSSYWTDSTSRGWRGIAAWDADGPDGMSRTLRRTGVRCQVDGEWDGGDDADSTAVRSKRVIERTTCWGDSIGLTARDTSAG